MSLPATALSTPMKILTGAYLTSGAIHMVRPAVFDHIVPPVLPGSPTLYTYASGIAELVTAGLLINSSTRRFGGALSAALLLAVWPANVEMARQWLDKPWTQQVISIGRLPLQIPLIIASWKTWKGE